MTRDTGIRIAATIAAGAVLTVVSPPANVHWLHWFACVPMFWVLRADTPRANWRFGWLYGAVGVGLVFHWIATTITLFSPGMPAGGGWGVLVLFSIVFGAPYALLWWSIHPLRTRIGPWWVLAWPAVQVLIEWFSMHVLLFPYNLGATQYRVPAIWQLVSVTGAYGVTFLLFLVNAAIGETFYRWREGRRFSPLPGALAAGVLSAVVLYGHWRYERVEAALREGPVLRVAQLQSPNGMDVRMRTSSEDEFAEWLDPTRAIVPGTADLVVWPEGASPFDPTIVKGRSDPVAAVLAETARAGGFDLVIGAGRRETVTDAATGEIRSEAFNSVYWFHADGSLVGHYDKMVPLPFGEYLPFGRFVPGLADALRIGDFRAGHEAVIFDGTKVRAGTPICYEAILPSVCRLFREADLLVNVTNDAWFGKGANPYQHAMLAATRAVELGIPMYRSAYTGISLVVEPHGVMHDETVPFEREARIVTVRMQKFDTLYARFGDWFVGVCAAGLVAAGVRMQTKTAARG